jgi:hypothetical protein
MTNFKRTTGFLALAACLLAAGCGSDDEGQGLPPDSVAALDRQLDSIQSRFEVGGGACNDITDGSDPNTTAVQRTINGLPGDVDQDVRDALEDGFARLFQLVQEQCEQPQTQTEPETVTEPPPAQPTETEPETETETTPPPETTVTTPPPTETEAPPPTETAPPTGEGGSGLGAEGGSGGSGQGGDGSDAQGGAGGAGGGALVPEDEG